MITEEEFLTLTNAKYATINALNEKPTMLDYKQGLVDILHKLGREVIQANLSKSSKDRRKKEISINPWNNRIFKFLIGIRCPFSKRISPVLKAQIKAMAKMKIKVLIPFEFDQMGILEIKASFFQAAKNHFDAPVFSINLPSMT